MSALAQLTKAHDDILAAILKLEALTDRAEPDSAGLAMARWKLTQASRSRRRLLEDTVYPEIERRSLADRPEVHELRGADAGLIAASSQHITTWDIDLIVKRWRDYRAASAGVIASMRERIGREKAVLYPLLMDTGAP